MADVAKRIFGGGAPRGSTFTPGKFGGFTTGSEGTITLHGKKFDAEGNPLKAPAKDKTAFRAKILSRGFTAVSAFGDIAGGFQEAAALKSEGRQLDLQARQASLQGASAAINESIRANEAIGSQVVATPTSLTGSSAGSILSEFEDTQSNIGILKLDAAQRSLLLRDAANKARKRAKFAKIAGFFKAGQRVGTAFIGGGS